MISAFMRAGGPATMFQRYLAREPRKPVSATPSRKGRAGRLVLAGCAVVCMLGCGAFRPQDGIPDDERHSATCLDLWSLAHAAGGATIAHEFGDDSFVPTMLVTAGFEAVEPVINPWWDESLENQRCDVVFNTLGWLIQSLAK